MSHRCLSTALIAACLMLPGVSGAVELLDGRVEFNAYGSVGLARASIENPGYRSNFSYQFDVGKQWTGRLDNRLGVQLTAHLDPAISVVTQGLIRRNGGDEVTPETTWAYLRWRPDTRWELRLGRVRQPIFLISEEFDVGYSQPWVRPPVELYTLGGESTTVDGAEIRYRYPIGAYTMTLEGYAGVSHLDRPNYEIRTHLSTGIAATLTDGELTLRGSLVRADINLKSPRISPIYNLIAAQNTSVARDYQTGELDSQYYGNLGLRYESNGWLAVAEYAQNQSPTKAIAEYQGAYLTVGHSFGDWLPYVTLSRIRTLSSTHEDRLSGTAAAAANALLATQNRDQSALSIGTRWDVYPGIALKAQVDRVRPDTGAYGLQAAPLPPGKSAFNVVSFVMDWAF